MKELLKQTGEWPRFAVQGKQLRARAYEYPDDGRRYVHIATPGEMRTTAHITNGDSTRLIYRKVGIEKNKAILLGMAARREHRGQGIGRDLLEYFMENIEEQEDGAALVGTGRIHKPVIALCLANAGFTPRSEDFVAELLPDENRQTDIPSIRIIRNDLDPTDIVTGNGRRMFYQTVEPTAISILPQASREVALHTTYEPPLILDQIAA